MSDDGLVSIAQVEADTGPGGEGDRRRPARMYHAILLGGCVGVLLLAALLQVREDQRVEFLMAPGRPLPDVCQSRVLWGIPCPGCGLTRCFIHAMHGDLAAAAEANVAGLPLVLLALTQIPYRIWRMRSPRELVWRTRDLILILTLPIVLLWGNWITRLIWPG